jgi:hypothetical protein
MTGHDVRVPQGSMKGLSVVALTNVTEDLHGCEATCQSHQCSVRRIRLHLAKIVARLWMR